MNRKLLMIASLMSLSFVTLIQSVSTPDASRVYADRFIPEVLPYQAIGIEGTLDGSFGTTGSLSLTTQLASSQAKVVKVLIDGSILVVLDDGTNSNLVKYTSTGAVDTTFATSGILALTGLTGSQTMIVDSESRIIIAGSTDSGGHPWARRVTEAGVIDSSFALIDGQNWSLIGSIAEQSSGRLIFAGEDNSTGYSKIAGYTPTGVVDTDFGTSGIIIFDGSAGHPLSSSALYTVSIASDDSVLTGYKNGSAYLTKFDSTGVLVSAFNSAGILPGVLPDALGSSSVTAAQVRVALSSDGNICIAGQIGNDIIVNKYDVTTGAVIGGFTTTTITDASDVLNLSDFIALSDGKLITVGYNSTDTKMRVTQITSAGAIDTTAFNVSGTPAGNNEFAIGAPNTSSTLYSGSVSPDGRLYVAGSQVDDGTTTPYLSRIFDELYVSSVAQYPATRVQGDLDLSFGTNSSETYRGVNYLFNGKYGATLQQKANAVIELASGKILIGQTGLLDATPVPNMMLTRLNADGTLDTSFNTTGKLSLTPSFANEYLLSIFEDKDANIIVSGYDGSANAILRKFDSSGSLIWSVSDAATDQAVNIGIQSSQRILLFRQTGATTGGITAINPSTGALDTTFNSGGSTPGKVTTSDLGLTNMGPVFGSFIDMQDNIMIAYRNSATTNIDVAYIFADGASLISQFGTSGIIASIFTAIPVGNVRLAMDNDERVIVAVADGANFKLKRFYLINGTIDTNFGTAGLFSFSAGTAAVLNQLTTLDNNTIVVTGADNATDDSMLISRVTEAGALDTVFNSQGETQGILPVQIGNIVSNYYSRSATGLAVQASSGNMIVVGNEQQTSTSSIPMVARIYGQSGTTQVKQSPVIATGVAGTIDTTFGSDEIGAVDLTSLIAAGSLKTVYAYRSTNANQGKMLLGVDTINTQVKISRFNEYNETLDNSFGSSGTTTLATLSGLNHLSLDANNKIIVGGTYSGTGWAKRLHENGAVDVAFENLANLVEINAIYQQKSGRYIVTGKDSSGNGVLVAFQVLEGTTTYLEVDTTFNPLGTTPGWYQVGTTGLYNLAINSDDTLLVAYEASATVKIAKITANASGLVSEFGTSGALDTGINPRNAREIRVEIDSNGKVIIASSVGIVGSSVSVARYSAAGVIDSGFNGGAVNNITGLGSVGVRLSDVIITNESGADDKIILLGSNTAGGNGHMFAARLDTDGTLDVVFNKVPTGADVAGILTFTLNDSLEMNRGSIYIDGSIYVGAAGTGDKPLLMAIFGDDYIGQTEEQPFEVAAGIIDTTLDYAGATGALNLDTDLSVDLAGYYSKKLYIYDDGSMLIGFDNNVDTSKVVKLKADRSLDTTFNSAGTPGYVTITNAEDLRDMYVANGTNDDGAIYVVGDDPSNNVWSRKFSSDGVDSGDSISDTDARYALDIRKTSNGRLLVSAIDRGSNNTVVIAYKADGSARDLSFGSGNGDYDVGIDGWAFDSVDIDSEDRLYYAYPAVPGSATTITVERLKANGTAVDAWSAFGTAISTAGAPYYVLTTLDEANNRLVVAVQDTNTTIYVRRYNATTGADDGGLVTIALSGKALATADLFIDTDQKIYVTGTNTTDNNIVVARITSSMALDTTYATTGIANLVPGANMTSVTSAALHPDRRVYVVGRQGTPTPSMARVFGDEYVVEETQVTFKAIPGTPDVTLDPNAGTPDAGLVISGLTGYTAQAVYANADGSSFIAFGNGTNVILGKYDADNVAMSSTFGIGSGLTSPVAMTTVNNLIISDSNIIVVGTEAGAQKLLSYSSSGTTAIPFDSTTVMSVGTQVAQQKSGRYLVTGKFGSLGIVLAYQNDGLATDTTFGPAALDGYYSTGVNSQIDDIVVDSDDNAYIVYRDTTVKIQKISANGAELVTTFTGGDTTITATAAAHLAINSSGDILVGVTTSAGIQTVLYNGTTGNASPSPVTLTSANSPILTRMVGVGTEFASSAYTTAPAMLTILQTSTGVLDTTFNPSGTTPGIASSDPETAVQMNSISVQPDGKFVMVGRQDISSVNPVIMRVYGNPYVAQYAQYPGVAVTGTLDTTLSPSVGDLNLDSLLSAGSLDLSGYVARRIYTYTNNNLLVSFDDGTDSLLVRMQKDFTLDTTFNSVGYLALAGVTGVAGMYVDENDNIFVTGGATTSWLQAFNNDGTNLTGFTAPTANLSAGAFAVELQSLNRIIVSGQDASGGVLYGYTSTTGELDTMFGNGTAGVYKTNIAAPISDISIDNLDRITIVYTNGGNTVIERVNSDGSAVDTLSSPTSIGDVSGNQVQVVNDISGNLIVAAATSTGFTVKRYDTNGNDSGSAITGFISPFTLGKLYTTSDGYTVLVGSESTANNLVITRINSSFVADTAFNPNDTPGALAATVGSMTTVSSGVVYNDNRILLIGGNAAGNTPYMARIFGDSYVTLVKQSDILGLFGALDTTYGTAGSNSLTSLLSASIPYSVRSLADGSVYVGVQNNGTAETSIAKLNGQGTAVNAFGTSGVEVLTGLNNIRDIQFDHAGKLLVTGGSTSSTWVRRLDPTDGSVINTFVSSAMKTRVEILEQTNDRIVVAGSNASDNGLLVGYTPDGSALDATFGQSSDGYFTDTTNINAPITAFAADSKGRIAVGYTKSSRAAVAIVRANGTSVDADYDDYTGFATTGFVADVFGTTNISGDVHVAVDSSDNVIVAAVNNSAADIMLKSYDSAGSVVNTATALSSLASPVITGIMVTNTNEVMVFGNYTGGVFTAQFTSGLILDATYGTGGVATYTIDAVSSLYAGSLTVDGIFYLTGNDASINPLLMRMYSDRFIGENDQQPTNALPGTFDVSFNGAGGANLDDRSASVSIAGHAGKAIYAYGDDKMLMALDNGSTTKLIRSGADGFLDTSFGTGGFASTDAPTGAQAIAIDVNGKILLSGTNWINRYAADGSSVEVFVTPSTFTNGSDVAQQISGRVLSSGYDSSESQGSLVAWQSYGDSVDTSFGIVTQISPTNDRYLTGIDANVDSFVVNNDDTFVIAYNNGNSVTLRQLNADASQVVSTFGTAGTLVAIDGTTVSGKALLIKDENQKLVIASRTNTDEIIVRRYTADGSSLERAGEIPGIIAPILTGLQETSTGQILVTGYNGAGDAFVARLQESDYALETDFGTAGIFTGTAAGLNQVHAATVRADGRIALLGKDSSSNPILLSVNGDPYVGKNTTAIQFPATIGAPGVLDTTFDSSGALNLNTALSGGTLDLTGSVAQHMHAYDDGAMLVAFTQSNSTIVVKLNKDQTLNTAGFGAGTGFVTIANASVVTDMFVDGSAGSDGSIYLTGTYSGTIWTAKLTAAGVDETFNVPNTLSMVNSYSIRKTTNKRILVAGKTGSLGTVAAYKSDGSALDVSFGDGLGAYQTTVNNSIADMQIDQYDRMYIAYINASGNLAIDRVLDNGGSVDSTFAASAVTPGSTNVLSGPISGTLQNSLGAFAGVLTPTDTTNATFNRAFGLSNDPATFTPDVGSPITGTFTTDTFTRDSGSFEVATQTVLSTTQIRLALDETNNQVVVAIQDGTAADNIIEIRRFSMVDGSDTGSLSTITLSGKVLNLADVFVDAGQDTYVIGYNATDSNVVVARIDGATSSTAISLDTAYGTAGIANVNAGSNLTIVNSGIIHLDGRIYVVGQDGSSTPSMARLFDEDYDLEDKESNVEGLPGGLDLTLDSSTGGIVLSDTTSFGTGLNGYNGREIFANADGSSYVAFGNDTNVIVGKLDSDQKPVASGFGTAGLTSAVTMAIVNSLAVDAQGRILVSGTNGGVSKVLRYPTDGTAPTVFAGVPALVVGNTVLEQKSGRILLSGRKTSGGSFGVVFAYQNTGAAADITFGPDGSDGFYAINVNQAIDDMVIDQNDEIYLVYRDTNLKLQKVSANGSGLNQEFASGVTIDTGIVATNTAHVAINDAGNILVGSPVGANIQTRLYNGTSGAAISAVETIADETPVLTQITGVADEFVASAYQTTGTAQMLTILVQSDGALDTVFAAGAGIAETAPQAANQMNGVSVQPDGRFLMIGRKTVSTVNYPVLERVYGTPYVTGEVQFPGTSVTGTLDTTLEPTTGDLNLSTIPPLSAAALSGFTAKRIHSYADAKVLLAFDNGTDTKIVKGNKDFTLDTSFNTVGFITLAGLGTVTSLYIDQYDNVFVAGSTVGIDSTSWVRGFSNTGAAIAFDAPTVNLANGGYAMEQQTMGRTILAGAQGTDATLIGYTNTGDVDSSFGVSGKATPGITAPISDITIDSLDRIIFSCVVSGSSVVNRLDTTGTIIDTAFGTPAALTGITGNELQVIQDNAGNIVIGVATSAGFNLRSYDAADGSTLYSSTNIAASGVSHLGNLYATSDGKIGLVGYTDSGNVVIARFNADLTLDGTFNPNGSPAGVLITTVGVITSVYDGFVYADDRVYIVGGGSDTDPYIARAFGDDYVTDLAQAPVYGVPGTLDLTLGTDGNGGFKLSALTGVGTSVPKTILAKTDGSMIIAMQKDTDETLVVNLDDNLTLDSAGIIDIASGAPGVRAVNLDALSRILVAGNSGTASWVNRYDASTGSAIGVFPAIPTMTSVVDVLTQSNGRVIVGGDQDSTYGVLAGLAPLSFVSGSSTTTPILDNSFGTSSRFTDSSVDSIHSFVIDPTDNIVAGFVGTSGSTMKIARVRPNGSALDTTFNSTGIVTTDVTSASGTKPVRVALDSAGKTVAATTTTTGISVRRYDDAGTTEDVSFDITNTASALTSPVITQLLTTATNQIIVLGYEGITDGNMFAMRLTSGGALDTTFNPTGAVPGVLSYQIDNSLTNHNLYAAAIAQDGRIVSVGFETDITV